MRLAHGQVRWSWQIVPTILPEMLQDKNADKAKRVMAAMLKTKKLDVAALRSAYEGRSEV